MTPEQKQILKAMPYWARVQKYFPLLNEGKINQEQYERVLSFEVHEKVSQIIPPEAFISAFGGVEKAEEKLEEIINNISSG